MQSHDQKSRLFSAHHKVFVYVVSSVKLRHSLQLEGSVSIFFFPGKVPFTSPPPIWYNIILSVIPSVIPECPLCSEKSQLRLVFFFPAHLFLIHSILHVVGRAPFSLEKMSLMSSFSLLNIKRALCVLSNPLITISTILPLVEIAPTFQNSTLLHVFFGFRFCSPLFPSSFHIFLEGGGCPLTKTCSPVLWATNYPFNYSFWLFFFSPEQWPCSHFTSRAPCTNSTAVICFFPPRWRLFSTTGLIW